MSIETTPFDAAKYLTEDKDQAELIADALGTGHHGCIAAALGVVARARGMSEVAAETGLNPQSLYAALRDGGNPTLDTVLKVVHALGLGLELTVRGRVAEAA